MYSTILVPVDEYGPTDAVVDRAFDLAQMYSATVHVLAVTDTGAEPVALETGQRDELRQSLEKRERLESARIRDRAKRRSLDVTRTVREGVPHRILLEYATENEVDAIVIGTRSHAGPDGVRLGSTTERVVTLSSFPVFVVPEPDDSDATTVGYDHIVIATDGSDVAARAADHGFELAETYGAEVSIVYVIDETTYELSDAPRSIVGLLKEGGQNAVDEIASDGRDTGLSVEGTVLRGDPSAEIAAYTDDLDGSMVAMGTRGRGGATGELLGSTTARVLRRATRPILIVS